MAEQETAVAAADTSTIKKAEAVRRLLAEQPDISPQDGVNLLRERYGLEMTAQHFSNTRSQIRRKAAESNGHDEEAHAPARPAASVPVPAPASAPSVAGPSLDDLRAVRKMLGEQPIGAALTQVRAVKEWANKVGGLEPLETCLDTLQEFAGLKE